MTAPIETATAERAWMGVARKIATPALSVVLAMLIGSVIIKVSGYDPAKAFAALLMGAFGGMPQIGETLLRSTPLVFTGLAVAYGFRANLFNIGAEGQLFMGGLAAAVVGVTLGATSWWVGIPVVLIAGAGAGAAWAFVPGVLKARVGAHEVITTMMFGYIARYFVSWMVVGPLKAPGPIPQTAEVGVGSRLPLIGDLLPMVPLGRAHMGIFVAVVASVFVWLILKYTTLGYENRAVGFNASAAETGGISVASTTVKALCISGALAGLAGTVEVMGVHYRIFDQFSSGFGFTGIAVALLAKNNPLGVVAAALLFGALSAGAPLMQLEADVPAKVTSIIQALIIFFVAADAVVDWFIRRRQKAVTADAR
jgi:ABC-type uncharacterized transport system permease subunit